MGKLMFGWDEQIECIQPIGVKGHDGEALCLAYKTSKLFVGAGVYLRDDGYVLGVVSKHGSFYPLPDGAKVKAWQAEGMLPDPLPGYSVPFIEYAFGYSLWIVLAGVVAWALVQRALTKRRHASYATTPVSLGPPQLETDGDRFITSTASAMMHPGEQLQQQAWAPQSPENLSHCYYVALTSERLLLFHAKRGAFKPVLETTGVEEIPRAAILGASELSHEITLRLSGGVLVLAIPQSQKHFTNQQVFVRDVPRLLAAARIVAPGAPAVA